MHTGERPWNDNPGHTGFQWPISPYLFKITTELLLMMDRKLWWIGNYEVSFGVIVFDLSDLISSDLAYFCKVICPFIWYCCPWVTLKGQFKVTQCHVFSGQTNKVSQTISKIDTWLLLIMCQLTHVCCHGRSAGKPLFVVEFLSRVSMGQTRPSPAQSLRYWITPVRIPPGTYYRLIVD